MRGVVSELVPAQARHAGGGTPDGGAARRKPDSGAADAGIARPSADGGPADIGVGRRNPGGGSAAGGGVAGRGAAWLGDADADAGVGQGGAGSGGSGGSGGPSGAGADAARAAFPDWRFAPNIGGHPDVYEIENQALDRAGHVLHALRRLAPWAGKTIVDLGCGTGFWLPRYAAEASRVIGIEPDPGVRTRAARAACAVPSAKVVAGSAEHTGLADRSVDVVHARFAYFFPPGTDAGLTEVLRVLRPGGHLIMVDNDYRWGQFADLLAAASRRPPRQVAATVDAWWRARGATRHEIRSELRFASRADLAAVLHIEVPPDVATAWLARNPSATGLTYGYTLFDLTA
jgi:SAM-dependent methyltransferase